MSQLPVVEMFLCFFYLSHVAVTVASAVGPYRVINRVRDVIVTGLDGDIALTLEHRREMFANDWLPAKFGLAFAHLVLAAIGLFPAFVIGGAPTAVRLIAFGAASLPAIVALSLFVLGTRDLLFILRRLDLPMSER